ncbi:MULTISPECIES: DUF6461 domain-containing protein [Actinomadura]|uniref:DUF6461 domain-containing protein n=1 Tax=Actinomadura yumaensis TaxID=111807 RepID=A0ABW2CUC5_9ACTN|nr:DUF6461 domain-containing protein [Actinomadura sp. J1-007]MWK35452.1 hypothetical protein [Actinomadura sp. J1-007]
MAHADSLEAYRALLRRDPGLGGALCVTWCQGAPEVVAERFGADLSTAVPSTLDAARAAEPEYQVPLPTVLLVGDLGEGWSLAVEINGFQGTRPEVLRALTAGGETAYAAYWNINLDSRVVLAESGRVVGAIEPFDGDDMWGAAPERLSRHFEGLPLGRPSDDLLQVPDTDIKAAALLAGERATGRGVDAGWLDRRHVRYLITDGLAPDGPALNELADHPLVRADPRLGEIVADPVPARLPTLLDIYVTTILDYCELDDPDVARARALVADRPAGHEADQAVQRLEAVYDRLKRSGIAARARGGGDEGPGSEAQHRFQGCDAVRALISALDPDPTHAMEETIWAARNRGWPGIEERLALLSDIFELIREGTP